MSGSVLDSSAISNLAFEIIFLNLDGETQFKAFAFVSRVKIKLINCIKRQIFYAIFFIQNKLRRAAKLNRWLNDGYIHLEAIVYKPYNLNKTPRAGIPF